MVVPQGWKTALQLRASPLCIPHRKGEGAGKSKGFLRGRFCPSIVERHPWEFLMQLTVQCLWALSGRAVISGSFWFPYESGKDKEDVKAVSVALVEDPELI